MDKLKINKFKQNKINKKVFFIIIPIILFIIFIIYRRNTQAPILSNVIYGKSGESVLPLNLNEDNFTISTFGANKPVIKICETTLVEPGNFSGVIYIVGENLLGVTKITVTTNNITVPVLVNYNTDKLVSFYAQNFTNTSTVSLTTSNGTATSNLNIKTTKSEIMNYLTVSLNNDPKCSVLDGIILSEKSVNIQNKFKLSKVPGIVSDQLKNKNISEIASTLSDINGILTLNNPTQATINSLLNNFLTAKKYTSYSIVCEYSLMQMFFLGKYLINYINCNSTYNYNFLYCANYFLNTDILNNKTIGNGWTQCDNTISPDLFKKVFNKPVKTLILYSIKNQTVNISVNKKSYSKTFSNSDIFVLPLEYPLTITSLDINIKNFKLLVVYQ
jgi:hypothetical protein